MGSLGVGFNAFTVVNGINQFGESETENMLMTRTFVSLIGCGDFLIGIYLVGLSIFDSFIASDISLMRNKNGAAIEISADSHAMNSKGRTQRSVKNPFVHASFYKLERRGEMRRWIIISLEKMGSWIVVSIGRSSFNQYFFPQSDIRKCLGICKHPECRVNLIR